MYKAFATERHGSLTISEVISLISATAVVLTVLFGEYIAGISKLKAISISDDVSVLLMALLLGLFSAYRTKIHVSAFIWIIAIILLTTYSIISSYSKGVLLSAISAILYCKIFVLFFVASRLEFRLLKIVIKVVALVHVLGFLINVILPNLFFPYLPEVTFERDASRIVGFELNANRFGAISAVLTLYFMFIRRNWILACLLLLALFMSGSRSFFVLFVVIAYYLSTVLNNERVINGKFISVVGILAIVFMLFGRSFSQDVSKAADTYGGEDQYIRAAMLYGGGYLAIKYFPLGTGGGTYGSPLSIGSDVYVEVGIANWPSVMHGIGIHDSGMGSLLGEYGVLGFISVMIFLFVLFSAMSKGVLQRKDIFFLIGITIFLSFFRGVVSSYFYSMVIFLVFVLLCNARNRCAFEGTRLLVKTNLA